tara:strand:+ start:245 stop:655 length:411 start_codon:yes stop_codon:yes gene_type:complete
MPFLVLLSGQQAKAIVIMPTQTRTMTPAAELKRRQAAFIKEQQKYIDENGEPYEPLGERAGECAEAIRTGKVEEDADPEDEEYGELAAYGLQLEAWKLLLKSINPAFEYKPYAPVPIWDGNYIEGLAFHQGRKTPC